MGTLEMILELIPVVKNGVFRDPFILFGNMFYSF